MPSAMVDMIQPNSDLILIAGRTPMRSTNAPCTKPNTQTSGIISQKLTPRSTSVRPTMAPSMSASPCPKFSGPDVANVSG